MAICSIFWILDIINWRCQHEEMQSKYAYLSNVGQDIVSIKPLIVEVEVCVSPGRDAISWSQSIATGETLHEKLVIKQFAQFKDGIWAGDNPALGTTNPENDSAIMKEAEER
jgi:hypothetical protein